MAVMLRRSLSAFLLTVVLLVIPAIAQESSSAPDSQQTAAGAQSQARKQQSAEQQPPLPQSQTIPRSVPEGESSSRTTVDLSPPPNDAAEHEGAAVSDVEELHQYDPHRAMKDVEVGDFYFKRGNYFAAASRYAGALHWKPNDAIATYRLAQSQEKLGRFADALKNYQGYLKILPHGDLAEDARQGITRMAAKLPANTSGKLQSKETAPSAPSARTPR